MRPKINQGFTLVEVVCAFTLLLLFTAGLVQVLSYQTASSLRSTLQSHLNNQNRILGNFLASYTGEYEAADLLPVGSSAPGLISFPSTFNPLSWSGLRFTDGKTVITNNGFAADSQALKFLSVEYDENGRWVAPVTGAALSAIGESRSWAAFSTASGCAVNCDLSVTPSPTDSCCISLVNTVKRANLVASSGYAWTARMGGGGQHSRETPWGTRKADGDGLQYEIRIFKEKVADTPLPAIRVRVWMKLSDTNPTASVMGSRGPLVVETVYPKRQP